jgi:transposase-like protein
MHAEKTVQRFIELRVQGYSFARIAQELDVSRNTLITWSQKHQHTIANLAAIEREHRLQEYLASSEERMRKLGEQLRVAETELAKRDLTPLSTGPDH